MQVGKGFTYTARTTCYIEVHEDGTVTHGHDRAAYERAVAGKSRLFTVWPGEWSSHLFVIDDLDEYAKAHGIKHDEERTGLKEHVHDVRWLPPSPHSKTGGIACAVRPDFVPHAQARLSGMYSETRPSSASTAARPLPPASGMKWA